MLQMRRQIQAQPHLQEQAVASVYNGDGGRISYRRNNGVDKSGGGRIGGEDDTMELSMNSINRIRDHNATRIKGMVGGDELVMLIDSSGTQFHLRRSDTQTEVAHRGGSSIYHRSWGWVPIQNKVIESRCDRESKNLFFES